MPSSPKFFHARQSASQFYSRRSIVLVLSLSLIIGISGFVFGLTAFLNPSLGYRCSIVQPRSVRVVWEKSGGGGDGEGGNGGEDGSMQKVMGFVGIQTGFASVERRQSFRKTWMPSDQQGLQRFIIGKTNDRAEEATGLAFRFIIDKTKDRAEEATGLAFRFIIGKTKDRAKMSELRKEVATYDDFLELDIEEEYSKLPYKTLAYFKAAYALFKADDDIYLRPDRLSLLLAKERSHTQTYIGCMKKGPVFTDPKLKCFLMFSNEDVTIGAWMLAMNVNHENNHALCEPDCTATSIAVWDIPKCSGLCNPENKLLELHQKESCSKTPTLPSEDE